jgi:hypothetical protein
MVVIMGWGDARARDRGEVAPATCPKCHNDVFMHEVHSEKQFSLYFVPLSSYGGKEYLLCPICHFGVAIETGHKHAIDEMRAATAVYRRGRVPADQYRVTVDRFWATIGRNNRGQQVLMAPASLHAGPSSTPAPALTPQPGPAPDLAKKLAELGKLHEDGVLTQAEFTAAKRRVLGG